jgi:hypothetical protein
VLTEDFFERGLPARFLFDFPPATQIRWSEATIPDDLRNAVLELFEEIWLLQPEYDELGMPRPKLLGLDEDAKAEYVAFYNECGEWTIAAGENEEAAWNKLSGYAPRLALVGQVAHNPRAEVDTGEVMRAACDLARRFGKEAMRIYASLAETREQREDRELCEFAERRGGSVTVRDVTHYYWPLKGQRDEAEARLSRLIKNGFGRWQDSRPTGPGRPTRVFQLLLTSPSPKFPDLRGKTPNYGDGDVQSVQKITLSKESESEGGWVEEPKPVDVDTPASASAEIHQ